MGAFQTTDSGNGDPNFGIEKKETSVTDKKVSLTGKVESRNEKAEFYPNGLRTLKKIKIPGTPYVKRA